MKNLKSIFIVLGFIFVALPQRAIAVETEPIKTADDLSVLTKRTQNPNPTNLDEEVNFKKRKLNSSETDKDLQEQIFGEVQDDTRMVLEEEESEIEMQEFAQFPSAYEKKAFSSDGNTLAAIQDHHRQVVLYTKQNNTFEEDQTISPRGSLFFYHLKFSPDGKRLVLFQSDNCILLYKKAASLWIKFNEIRLNNPVKCKFSQSGKTLAVKHSAYGDEFYTVTLLTKLNQKAMSIHALDHYYSIDRYRFSQGTGGLALATITACGQLHLYAFRNKVWIRNEGFAIENVQDCKFSSCGRFLAVITLCGRVILYQKQNRQWIGLQYFDAPHVVSCSFSTEESMFSVISGTELRSYFYDEQNWKIHKSFDLSQDTNRSTIVTCRFSDNGESLAVLRKDDTDTLVELNIFKNHNGSWMLAFEQEFEEQRMMKINITSKQIIMSSYDTSLDTFHARKSGLWDSLKKYIKSFLRSSVLRRSV